MPAVPFAKGLFQVGTSSHAYLIPDGDWGASNAGLIVDGDQSLLVDTLFDLRMTADMLKAMADAHPAARRIDTLVNSHADGDHTFGNELVGGARIIASRGTFEEFHKLGPQQLHDIIVNADQLGEGARFIAEHMGPDKFDFSKITLVEPTETYERDLTLKIGDKLVELHNVGPAHTRGDTLVHVVEDRVVYTGDVLFIGVHPAIWDGSVEGWIAACDRILAMDVDVVVPGHGPVTDKAGVADFRRYLVMLVAESTKRHNAGMTVEEAALDIVLGAPFADWVSPERIAGSVNFLFRNWGSPHATDSVLERFAMIARYAKAKAGCPNGGGLHHDHGA
jgi:cyclase